MEREKEDKINYEGDPWDVGCYVDVLLIWKVWGPMAITNALQSRFHGKMISVGPIISFIYFWKKDQKYFWIIWNKIK